MSVLPKMSTRLADRSRSIGNSKPKLVRKMSNTEQNVHTFLYNKTLPQVWSLENNKDHLVLIPEYIDISISTVWSRPVPGSRWKQVRALGAGRLGDTWQRARLFCCRYIQ